MWKVCLVLFSIEKCILSIKYNVERTAILLSVTAVSFEHTHYSVTEVGALGSYRGLYGSPIIVTVNGVGSQTDNSSAFGI